LRATGQRKPRILRNAGPSFRAIPKPAPFLSSAVSLGTCNVTCMEAKGQRPRRAAFTRGLEDIVFVAAAVRQTVRGRAHDQGTRKAAESAEQRVARLARDARMNK
jgi:hypothetical protein